MRRLMTMIGVSGWMFLLVPAHPDCPGQNPESHKMVVCVCVCVCEHYQQHKKHILETTAFNTVLYGCETYAHAHTHRDTWTVPSKTTDRLSLSSMSDSVIAQSDSQIFGQWTEPRKPNQDERREIRMSWSIVSKVAERSRRQRHDTLCDPVAFMR